MTTVDAIRLVTGYFASFPDIVHGCDMDESIASTINTLVNHGWKALCETWDLTEIEAACLVEAGKYRCGVIENPYKKPIETVGKTRHMVQSDAELLNSFFTEG